MDGMQVQQDQGSPLPMKHGPEKSSDKEFSLDGLVKKCVDSEGYFFFCGILTDESGRHGNRKIVYHYRRYHFPVEDLFKKNDGALAHFKTHITDDLEGMTGAQDTEGGEE